MTDSNVTTASYMVIPHTDFKKNAAIDVSPWVKVLQSLSYVPWNISLSLLREYDPELAVEFEYAESGHPFFVAEGRGVYLKAYVYNKVTGKRTPSMIHSVRNNSRKTEASADMATITNQMQRAVAKVIAQEVGIGWGLYSKYDDSLAELEETSAPVGRVEPSQLNAPKKVLPTKTKPVVAEMDNSLDF